MPSLQMYFSMMFIKTRNEVFGKYMFIILKANFIWYQALSWVDKPNYNYCYLEIFLNISSCKNQFNKKQTKQNLCLIVGKGSSNIYCEIKRLQKNISLLLFSMPAVCIEIRLGLEYCIFLKILKSCLPILTIHFVLFLIFIFSQKINWNNMSSLVNLILC